jgi:hypothetical protein
VLEPMKRHFEFIRLGAALLTTAMSTTPLLAAADNSGQSTELPAPGAEMPAKERLMNEFLQGFYWRLNVLAFGTFQNLRDDSSLNPENVLRIPTYQLAFNPKLDLNLNVRQFELGVKPRFIYLWDRWTEGLPRNQQDNRTEFYVNEWIARVRPVDELSISYGRENLQWGPSIILSSSNPFNQQNGQSNPWLEVPGLDYGRAVWIPSSTWAASFIANTDKGRLDEPLGPAIFQIAPSDDFEKGYALKIDWTGEGKYFTVIPSYREDTAYRIGFFGGWNVTDAILLYTEGSDGNYDGLQLQMGGSYTFEGGSTVHLEYFHNGDGCVSKKIDRCFRDGDVDFNDPFFRGDYLMLQYNERDILEDFSVNFRLLNNLSDQSIQLTGILGYEVGENTELYLVGTGFVGDGDTEYGNLLTYSLFGGVSYTF